MWTVIAQKPDLLYMSMLVNVLKIIVIIIIIKEHPVFILSWQVHLNRAKLSHNQHWAIQPPNEGATRHEAMKLWDPATRCDGLPQIPLFYFVWFFWLFGFVKKKENVFGTLSNTPVTYLYIVNMYFNLLMSYNKYDQCSWWAGVSNCTRAETRSHLRKKDKILFFFLNIYINYQYYCLTDMYWYWRVSCQMFFNALPNATLQGIVSPPGIKLDTFCLSG